jgi:hypothetical protein
MVNLCRRWFKAKEVRSGLTCSWPLSDTFSCVTPAQDAPPYPRSTCLCWSDSEDASSEIQFSRHWRMKQLPKHVTTPLLRMKRAERCDFVSHTETLSWIYIDEVLDLRGSAYQSCHANSALVLHWCWLCIAKSWGTRIRM